MTPVLSFSLRRQAMWLVGTAERLDGQVPSELMTPLLELRRSIEAMEPIEIQLFQLSSDPVKAAQSIQERGRRRTVGEVKDLLNTKLLNADSEIFDENQFSAFLWNYPRSTTYKGQPATLDTPFPEYRWIASYAVTGGSEGQYVHVDAITDGGRDGNEIIRTSIPLYLCKTFKGWDHACRIATLAGWFLGA